MKLAIIGGGTMGMYTANEMKSKADISVYSKESHAILEERFPYATIASSVQDAVRSADAVLFCVPVNVISYSMAEVLPHCKKGTLVSGQTSRKLPEAEAYDDFMINHKSLGLEYASIHTMCNPETSLDPRKEILAIVRHHSTAAMKLAGELYGSMSDRVEYFDSVFDHDMVTAHTQIDVSRTFLSIASAFAKVGCFPESHETYSGAVDVMKFSLAMRAARAAPHIYKGIQFGSHFGKTITQHALDVENRLYRMIVDGKQQEYRDMVLRSGEQVFQNSFDPLLRDSDLEQFGTLTSDNSHFSIIPWVVSLAESKRSPYADLRATTPQHTSLLCLADRLFRKSDDLEAAISAPFTDSSLRADDLGFHNEVLSWGEALLNDNEKAYDSKHQRMRDRIPDSVLEQQIEKSKDVIAICRKRMDEFLGVCNGTI